MTLPLLIAALTTAAGLTVAGDATPGQPCSQASHDCPQPVACPPPPPLYVQGNRCEADPNPLVYNAEGKCCAEQACTPFHCPEKCMTDNGAPFAHTEPAKASDKKEPFHFYDCSRTDVARQCLNSIDPQGSGAACGCLVSSGCASTSQILRVQDSQCVLTCRDPKATGEDICINYDDEEDLCLFHSKWLCVMTSASCDASRVEPAPTACEAKCLSEPLPKGDGHVADAPETPEARLDRFVRCVTGCTLSSSSAVANHANATASMP